MNDEYLQAQVPQRRRVEKVITLPPRYEIVRWRWLLWILRKLRLTKKQSYVADEIVYHTITVRASTVLDFLLEMIQANEQYTACHVTDAFIGRKYWDRLLTEHHNITAACCIPITAEHNYRHGFARGTRTIYGVRVWFIPWFDGILLITEEQRRGMVAAESSATPREVEHDWRKQADASRAKQFRDNPPRGFYEV